ncbi:MULTISPECIES: hypothetical protein [Sphingobium]|jgi:hypothetical protein|uniref:Uncharacterized protein n=1 Tax=Sphingobium yanoikuyae TaxID=13690 RepID=A0A3G2UQK5_SPHYA|nr:MULTISPECIES: hypothetical protein [Sphingobium]AYO77323.1 hypothetical protein EBF16_10790 [Sphingobium yanoikuyae]MDV3481126.1 hypothetical protein [Sphingobium yanoikuyae]PHP17767.1 hypothetical protein CG471_21125 [Sphingobium sp. IP1]PZU65534.1 MAG: hypothetical protein DI540_16935 [Sphingobium sp.]QNG48596.1 hypothetical protein H3V42_14395 [Sphingobium yanoikuyae]
MTTSRIDQLIDEVERRFCAPIVDEDAAAGALQALFAHLNESRSRLIVEHGARLDDIQARFRAGPGLFKGDLH